MTEKKALSCWSACPLGWSNNNCPNFSICPTIHTAGISAFYTRFNIYRIQSGFVVFYPITLALECFIMSITWILFYLNYTPIVKTTMFCNKPVHLPMLMSCVVAGKFMFTPSFCQIGCMPNIAICYVQIITHNTIHNTFRIINWSSWHLIISYTVLCLYHSPPNILSCTCAVFRSASAKYL